MIGCETLMPLSVSHGYSQSSSPFSGASSVNESPVDLAFPIDEWHRVTLETTSTQVKFYIDGVLNGTVAHQTVPTPLRTTFKVGIPQIDGDNLQPWELRFDDVRCIRTQ